MLTIIGSLNQTLRGWFAYFKHSAKWVFRRLDGMIRRRLRSILSRRAHRPSFGRGFAHQHWPNAFFAKQGLFRHYLKSRLCRG